MSSQIYLIRSAHHIKQHVAFFQSEDSQPKNLQTQNSLSQNLTSQNSPSQNEQAQTKVLSPTIILLADALMYADAFVSLGCKVYGLEADIDLIGLKSEHVEMLSYQQFTILIESFDKIISFP